jgi:hypothetical protein
LAFAAAGFLFVVSPGPGFVVDLAAFFTPP